MKICDSKKGSNKTIEIIYLSGYHQWVKRTINAVRRGRRNGTDAVTRDVMRVSYSITLNLHYISIRCSTTNMVFHSLLLFTLLLVFLCITFIKSYHHTYRELHSCFFALSLCHCQSYTQYLICSIHRHYDYLPKTDCL